MACKQLTHASHEQLKEARNSLHIGSQVRQIENEMTDETHHFVSQHVELRSSVETHGSVLLRAKALVRCRQTSWENSFLPTKSVFARLIPDEIVLHTPEAQR